MNKRIILILGLLGGLVAVPWFGRFLASRKREPGDSRSVFRIAPFDQRSRAFVSERDAKWLAQMEGRNQFAESTFMRAIGKDPSVQGLTQLLCSATPQHFKSKAYWRSHPRQAFVEESLADLKEGYIELATLHDTNATPTLRVSDDGHLALLWTGTSDVAAFQDVSNGLRVTQYREK
jgi:hypothetical protein